MLLKRRICDLQPKEATIEHLKELIVDDAADPRNSQSCLGKVIDPVFIDHVFLGDVLLIEHEEEHIRSDCRYNSNQDQCEYYPRPLLRYAFVRSIIHHADVQD